MPRVYKPDPTSRRYKKYDPDFINKAVEEYYSCKSSLAFIAKKYNIHKSVLYRHSVKTLKKQGGQTVLSAETEDYIIHYINICGEWGYPLDTMDLRYIIKMYLDKMGVTKTRFKNNMPGPDFVTSFLNRHKDSISQRVCQNIKRSRAAVSPEVITAYFNELKVSLADVPAENILNFDETNLSDDPGRKKIITKRGTKYPERVVNHSKASISLMMAGTAAGELLSPYVVYKAQNMYNTWRINGPKGTRYNRTASGWFDGSVFEDWVRTIVIPFFENKEGKKLLKGDNLSSHLSIDVIKECKKRNIHFVFLPSNSTHLTQPLDVAFFRPMKGAWRQILTQWKKTDGRLETCVPKGCFPKLLKLLINTLSGNATENLKTAFRKTGIHPLNPDEVLSRLPGNTNDDDRYKEIIDESVLSLLKEMRYGTMNCKETKGRRKKVDVVAGRSVGNEEELDKGDSNIQSPENCDENDDIEPTAQPSVSYVSVQKRKIRSPVEDEDGYESDNEKTSKKKKFTRKIQNKNENNNQLQKKHGIDSRKGKGIGKKSKKAELELKEWSERENKSIDRNLSKVKVNSDGEEVFGKLIKEPENSLQKAVLHKYSDERSRRNVPEVSKKSPNERAELCETHTLGQNVEIMENYNLETLDLNDYTNFDLNSMPIYFEDNLKFENEVIIDNHRSETPKITFNNANSNINDADRTKNKVKILSDCTGNFSKDIVMKGCEKISIKTPIKVEGTNVSCTTERKKLNYYYRHDEDILRDLLNDE